MIYAIADLHLPSSLGKTMDRFGDHWKDHPAKLRRNWTETVAPGDSVLVCGDISWALHPEEARDDLKFLASLPGTKYLIRGNHDYWWRRSSTRLLQRDLPPGLVLVQGEGHVVEGIGVGGTRGWGSEANLPEQNNTTILQRELGLLRKAMESLPVGPRVAMLHYPPYDSGLCPNEFGKLLGELHVDLVVYGHLHRGNSNVLEGALEGVQLQLVAADRVDFCPQPLKIMQ
ncbi:MAG: metallophosphoesterase [Armatimonadota bacterium]|nr:metallophosphoesterase [Armatimonadota bacterium]